ncbi:NS1 [Fall chinook aquareovirus]|uniref:NS1 n=1 Tax=Fall chinook aquareovirus TaxID=1963254 RepID=UPI0009955847|nr:NS1 [Fall chinook aquareovirus]AQU42730.1 NS1 [Fall chinook aquareovirus]
MASTRISLKNLGSATSSMTSPALNQLLPSDSSNTASPPSITHPSSQPPPTWTITYLGTPFHGVCAANIIPYIPLAGYLSDMLTHVNAPQVPSRIQDVNNLVTLGLAQLGVTHITDDNTYGESRLAYARGNPATSPLYKDGTEIKMERAFFASFPTCVKGVWKAPTQFLPVIASQIEDLSLLTVHSLRSTATSNHFDVVSSSGECVAKLAILFINPGTELNAIHGFMASHPIISITPAAAAVMVRARLTDGVFSKSIRRIVMGIDPIMISMEQSGVGLWNVLTQHRLNFAETHASASLRHFVSHIERPLYAAQLGWMKMSLPTNVSAACEMGNDVTLTLTHLLNAAEPARSSTPDPTMAHVKELEVENGGLRKQLSVVQSQLEFSNAALDESNAINECNRRADNRDEMVAYLSSHVCMNTQECEFLTSRLGSQVASPIQAKRAENKSIAVGALTDKLTQASASTINHLQSRLSESQTKNDNYAANVEQLSAHLRQTTSKAMDLERDFAQLQAAHDLISEECISLRQVVERHDVHNAATVSRLQNTLRDGLPLTPLTYGQGQFALPPRFDTHDTMSPIDPATLLDL